MEGHAPDPKSLAVRLAKRFVARLAAFAPELSRAAVPRIVHAIGAENIAFSLLRSLPVDSIVVNGKEGKLEGAIEDVSVIQRYALQGEWSPKTTASIIERLSEHRGGTYIDIGANIGLTSIPVAAAGFDVWTFEPVPRNFGYLCRNAALNKIEDRLHANNLALLDALGEVSFELSPTNHGDHRYRRGDGQSRMGEARWQTVTVKAATLDDFPPRAGSPLIIKIDTQGSEPLGSKPNQALDFQYPS